MINVFIFLFLLQHSSLILAAVVVRGCTSCTHTEFDTDVRI
jgi:hypothetical protein